MDAAEIPVATELIRVAMNGIEARFARKTMDFHFGCVQARLDDGRDYFVYRREGKLAGLVGLHHYIWGPRENVWLTWFCIHPEFQRKGLGTELLDAAEKRARNLGYRKFFIETYDMEDFAAARSFYEARGFTKAGEIDNYLPNKANMVVYMKAIGDESEPEK